MNTIVTNGIPLTEYAAKEMLVRLRARANVMDSIFRTDVLPEKLGSDTVRYTQRGNLVYSMDPATEGVDSPGLEMDEEYFDATLIEDDVYLPISSRLGKLHPRDIYALGKDEVFQVCAEKMARRRIQALIDGATQVTYTNGGLGSCNTIPDGNDILYFDKLLRDNRVPKVTKNVRSGTGVSTAGARAMFLCFHGTAMTNTILGSIAAIGENRIVAKNNYGSDMGVFDTEMETAAGFNFRFIEDPMLDHFYLPNAGGAYGGTTASDGGVSSNLYPLIFAGYGAGLFAPIGSGYKTKSSGGNMKEVTNEVNGLRVKILTPEQNDASGTGAFGSVGTRWLAAYRAGNPKTFGILWSAANIA